jgi:hypothetical protein
MRIHDGLFNLALLGLPVLATSQNWFAVIRDGDFTLSESNTMYRCLTAKHARTNLLPQSPAARAAVGQ